jgi:hypothetical protein
MNKIYLALIVLFLSSQAQAGMIGVPGNCFGSNTKAISEILVYITCLYIVFISYVLLKVIFKKYLKKSRIVNE